MKIQKTTSRKDLTNEELEKKREYDRKWYKKNREKILPKKKEYQREYVKRPEVKKYKESKEYKEKKKAWTLEYRKNSIVRKKMRESGNKYYHKNNKKINKKIRERRKPLLIIPKDNNFMPIGLQGFKEGHTVPKKLRERLRKIHKGKHYSPETEITKEKRKYMITPVKDTKIEVKIQNFLKQLGIMFFTHQYMNQIKHSYQCDILIPLMNLVIECDGNYWHKYPIGLEKDHIRTKELIESGFKVLRLWECEIKEMELNDFRRTLNEI